MAFVTFSILPHIRLGDLLSLVRTLDDVSPTKNCQRLEFGI